MADKELVDYVKKTYSMGFSRDKIKSALLDAGHKNKEVEKAFAEAFPMQNSYPLDISENTNSTNFFGKFQSIDNRPVPLTAIYILGIFAVVLGYFVIAQGYSQTFGFIKNNFNGAVGYVIADAQNLQYATTTDKQTEKVNIALSSSDPEKGFYMGDASSQISCNSLAGEEADWCYFRQAKRNADRSSCSAIDDFELRTFCFGVFTQQGSNCNKIIDPTLMAKCFADK